jgi:hypothetical protein
MAVRFGLFLMIFDAFALTGGATKMGSACEMYLHGFRNPVEMKNGTKRLNRVWPGAEANLRNTSHREVRYGFGSDQKRDRADARA